MAGTIERSWSTIDWEADPKRAALTEVQRAVIGCLLSDGEPTWVVACDLMVDRSDEVEATLVQLEQMGLVYSSLAHAFEPGKDDAVDRWWAISDIGWDVLGLIKSPRYASWMRDSAEAG